MRTLAQRIAHNETLIRILPTASALAAILVFSLHMNAQTSIGFSSVQPGQPLIYNGTNSATTDPSGTVVDAYIYTLTDTIHDFCYKINTVWTAFPNATIDARGFPSTAQPSCASTDPAPIPASAQGRLVLGSYIVNTSISWVIPAGVEVVGIGTSGPSSTSNTTIKASATFNNADRAVIQLGARGGDSEAKLANLTVDCNSGSGNNCIYGVMNVNAINNSWVQDVVIENASAAGLMIAVAIPGIGGADSGVYHGITVQYTNPSCCNTSSPVGIELVGLDDGTLVRGLDEINLFGCNLTNGGGAGIYVDSASTKIQNANIQCYQTGIQIGCSTTVPGSVCSGTKTHNVQADNVYYHCTNGTNCVPGPPGSPGYGVTISTDANAGPAENVTLSNIAGTDSSGQYVANLINYPGTTFTHSVVQGALYIGDTVCSSSPCLTLLSSDPGVTWQVPNGISINP